MSETVLPDYLRQSMVERVARAMCFAAMIDPDWRNEDLSASGGRKQWEIKADLARAAISAMRDPTNAMTEAGRWPAEDDGPDACWRAMIDAALVPSPNTQTEE